MDINYHLENIESQPLFGKYKVHLSCYTIYKNEYILYLLELINNQYYFPHFTSEYNVLEETKQALIKLNLDGDVQGYYLLDDSCYIMITLHIVPNIENISPYIFGSIYEILFMRTCLGKSIDNSIIQLFIKHPYLLYLYDNGRKAIPELGYYMTTPSSLYFHSYIGLDPNERGNIIIQNIESIPEGSFIRVLSTLQNYNIKKKSSIKSRSIIVDNYMVVSAHKN